MLLLVGLVIFPWTIVLTTTLHLDPRLRNCWRVWNYLYVNKILRNLKDAFWLFQHDQLGNLFLRAARAADFIDRSNINEDSGFQLASAKAAQHRLDRGVWTSVHFGDMRRALSACERLNSPRS